MFTSRYKNETPQTILVHVGKEVKPQVFEGFGATVGGQADVATKLWELKGKRPHEDIPFMAWSIQDAAEYCSFLITTTAQYQRFASVIPTVGGDVDMCLVLPENRLQWIQRKKMASWLIGDNE